MLTTVTSNKFPEEDNQYSAVFCFLEGLSTITSIVEGFSVVWSNECDKLWQLI